MIGSGHIVSCLRGSLWQHDISCVDCLEAERTLAVLIYSQPVQKEGAGRLPLFPILRLEALFAASCLYSAFPGFGSSRTLVRAFCEVRIDLRQGDELL